MLVSVRVSPSSQCEKVLESDDGYMVYTHAHAHAGQANKRTIELLAKHIGIAKTSITIKSGHKSRHKIIELPEHVL